MIDLEKSIGFCFVSLRTHDFMAFTWIERLGSLELGVNIETNWVDSLYNNLEREWRVVWRGLG